MRKYRSDSKWRVTSEGEAAVKQHKEKHSKSPHIYRRSSVLDLLHDFGRHVAWGTAEHPDPLLDGDAGAEPEVYEFDSSFLADDYVLEFDVSVAYAL